MKTQPLISKEVDILLIRNCLIEEKSFFVKLNNYPNYDLLPYENNTFNRYIYINEFDFSEKFVTLYFARFKKPFLYDYDSIKKIQKELKITETNDEQILTEAYKVNKDLFIDYSFDYDRWDEFEYYTLEVLSLNNLKKSILYQGSFWGHTDSIDNWYYNFYTLGVFKGVSTKTKYIFEDLLIESITLFLEKKYKQAYFICFTALENFINSKIESNLKNKTLLKKFESIKCISGKNTLAVSTFKEFYKVRNEIAHGNSSSLLKKNDFTKFLKETLQYILDIKSNEVYEL